MDAWTPLGASWEEERRADGGRGPVLALLLGGAECPFTCVFCDLWQRTLDGPTPPGAIPAQIRHALAGAGPVPGGAAVKLYNASNFFDARAVPAGDDAAIAALVAPFARVIVESHPKLVGERCLAFAARLDARLEVAMGLETARPDVLARLDKGMTLEDFDRAAGLLERHGIDLRAFLLLPPPFLPRDEVAGALAASVAHAVARGATHVSLIPTRVEAAAPWQASAVEPTLDLIEDVFDAVVATPSAVVTVDLWDIDRHARCDACRAARLARLREMNLTGRARARVACSRCASSS